MFLSLLLVSHTFFLTKLDPSTNEKPYYKLFNELVQAQITREAP